MDKHERGALNILLVPLLLVSVLLIGVAVVLVSIYQKETLYKNNSSQLVNAAVQKAVASTKQSDAAQYAQEAKKPLKAYVSPATYGTITIYYPKTWSAYVDDEGSSSSQPLDAYFQPNFVPSVTNQNNVFALRFELINQSYNQVMQQFTSNAQQNTVTVAPYSLPKVPSVVGSIIKGQITTQNQGTMVVLPLRNYTFELWTESPQYASDFSTYILPNVSFSP